MTLFVMKIRIRMFIEDLTTSIKSLLIRLKGPKHKSGTSPVKGAFIAGSYFRNGKWNYVVKLHKEDTTVILSDLGITLLGVKKFAKAVAKKSKKGKTDAKTNKRKSKKAGTKSRKTKVSIRRDKKN